MDNVFEDRPTIYDGSQRSLRSELDLFNLPKTDISCLYSSDYVQCFPLLSVKDSFNPLEFLITTETNGYVDLSDSFLHLVCRILKSDGTTCTSTDIVAPSNLFFQLMWSNLELYLNGQLIYDASNAYSHVAYIQRLLTKSKLEKETSLRSELWYANAEPDAYTTTSEGFKQRYDLSSNSKQFSLLGQLAASLFCQPRWLPSGSELRVVLRRNQPEYCLDSAKDINATDNTKIKYIYEIDRAVFLVARKAVSPKIIDNHRQLLSQNNTFKYPLNDAYVKSFSIAKGLTSVTTDAILIGRIPKILVIGLVSSTAISGNLTKSPMNFAHYNLSEIAINWNADTIENRQVSLNFKTTSNTASDDFLVGLNTLRKAVGNQFLMNGLSRDNYTKGK